MVVPITDQDKRQFCGFFVDRRIRCGMKLGKVIQACTSSHLEAGELQVLTSARVTQLDFCLKKKKNYPAVLVGLRL